MNAQLNHLILSFAATLFASGCRAASEPSSVKTVDGSAGQIAICDDRLRQYSHGGHFATLDQVFDHAHNLRLSD